MMQRIILLFATIAAILLVGCGPSQVSSGKWISLDGPFAREIAAVLADPTHPGLVFAAQATGEISTSENDGASWLPTVSLGSDIHPFRFCVVGDNPSFIVLLTDHGIFRASGGRHRWSRITTAFLPPATGVRALAIDPWKPSTWFIGTEGHGVYKSIDSGRTCLSANGSLPGLGSSTVVDLVIDQSHPNEILAAVDGLGLVLSTDQGVQWTRLTEEFSPTGSQIIRVYRDGNAVVYATNAGSMRRSVDDGHSWSSTRLPREGSAIYSLERSPWAPRLLVAGTARGPILSSDFGLTWSDLAGSLSHLPCEIAFRQNGKNAGFFAFGQAVGLQRTSDGGMHWDAVDRGLGGSTVHLLATNEECSVVYAGLSHSIMSYNTASGTWSNPGLGLQGDSIRDICAAMTSPAIAIAATDMGGYKTLDGGRTWKELTTQLPFVPTALEMCPKVGTRVLAASENGLFISTDEGLSWVHSQPLTERYDVRSFTFMPTDASIVYAATVNTASIISHDGGFHWEPSRYGIDTRFITLITLDDNDPQVAFAWTPGGESFRSTNGGLEWNRYAPPWNTTDTVLMAVDRYTPSRVVAIVNNRMLYYTANGGGTWLPLQIRDIPGEITAALWNDHRGVLYAGIRHRGLYMLSLRGLSAAFSGE